MWFVSWRNPGVKKQRSKEFPNEKKARAFYMKLIKAGQAEAQAVFEKTVFEILRKTRRGTWVVDHTLANRKEAEKLFFRLAVGQSKYKFRSR